MRVIDITASPVARRATLAVAEAMGTPVPACTVLLASRAYVASILIPTPRTLSALRDWLHFWWEGRSQSGQTLTCTSGEDPVVVVHPQPAQQLWPTLVRELVHVVQAGRPEGLDEEEAYRIGRQLADHPASS
jgi:hypothetical protein